jgi:hypothetical protein
MLQYTATPSRRSNSRIPTTTQGVWACWHCNGREDVSRVRDLSLGGLFLETAALRAIGTHTKVDFLVGEGQIRADAEVRHVVAGRGLGLKLTAVTEQDRRKFASLLRRLRS